MADTRPEVLRWASRVHTDVRRLTESADDREFVDRAVTAVQDVEALMTELRGYLAKRAHAVGGEVPAAKELPSG